MALYCFTENPRDVFAEGIARGWLAAMRDFPRFKTREESISQALQEAEAMQADVCCITSLQAYQRMIISAYISAYALQNMSEREIVPYALAVKEMSPDEALALVRSSVSSNELQDFVDDAFTRYKREIERSI